MAIRRYLKIFSLFFVAVACCVFFSAPAGAFSISPVKIEINAAPGETVSGEIQLAGTGSTPQLARVYFEDIITPSEILLPGSGGTRSCDKWISLTPANPYVEPGGVVPLRYFLTVPKDAAPGSYWTFIMIESDNPEPRDEDRKIGVVLKTRHAVRMVVNVSGERKFEAAITSVEMARPPADGKFEKAAFIAQALIENTGNVFFSCRGYIDIKNNKGEVVKRLDIPATYVLPGRGRRVSVPVEEKLPPGQYVALVVVDYGGENYIAGESAFSVSAASTGAADAPAPEKKQPPSEYP